MWIVSGICLHGVVMGALFRPLNNQNRPRKENCQITDCCANNKYGDKEDANTKRTFDWSSLLEISLLKRPSFFLYVSSCGLCLLSKFS